MSGKLRILVVDDDQRMVRTLSDILRIKGHEAEPAESGEEALELARTRRPDCVLMDVKMSGQSGIETLRSMKAVHPDLPVVLMSAFATAEQAAEARSLGAEALLVKPIDLEAVLAFLSLLRKEESILVVDDDAAFCKSLQDIFGTRGYHVESEGDGGRVLARMGQADKLLIILDLKPPGVEALHILRQIRETYPTKPVILATGYREQMASAIAEGRRIGASACLSKPLETEALLGLVEEISRGKRRACLGEPF
ncbi:MAG: response regulator [Candidatus Methylomirabilia bacterium]